MNNHILAPRPGAVIFDLDGTLLDTEPLYSIASQRVLDPYGNIYTPELKKRAMGGSSTTSAQIVIDEYDLPLSAKAYLALREEHLLALFADISEISGAGDFVSAVQTSTVPLGLATSSHADMCALKLDGLPWASAFDVSICGDHSSLQRSKPAPDIFLLCAERLNINPSDCIAFEDSPNGIEAAKSAGMKVCALMSPYVTREDLVDADLIFSDYAELLDYTSLW